MFRILDSNHFLYLQEHEKQALPNGSQLLAGMITQTRKTSFIGSCATTQLNFADAAAVEMSFQSLDGGYAYNKYFHVSFWCDRARYDYNSFAGIWLRYMEPT